MTHEEAVEETGHSELADAASGAGGKQDAGTGEGKPSDGKQAADGDKSDAGKDDGSASAKPDDRKAVAPSVKRALPQTSDPTMLGSVAATALAGLSALGLGAASRRRK